MSDYSDKLKDSRWIKKRAMVLERDHFACVVCGGDKPVLHVHHRNRTKEPWEAGERDLVTLCAPCHGRLEAALREIRKQIDFPPMLEAVRLLISVSEQSCIEEASAALRLILNRMGVSS